jgi:hypothetical protein
MNPGHGQGLEHSMTCEKLERFGEVSCILPSCTSRVNFPCFSSLQRRFALIAERRCGDLFCFVTG